MTSDKTKSKFVTIIGDLDVLKIMLDGVFKGWKGTYDVLTADTNEYLFKAIDQPEFRPFCRALRKGSAEGERLCHQCDEEFASRVAKNPKTDKLIYFCHVGLMDVAVPIVINNDHLATIFFGQVRSNDPEKDARHFRSVERVESKFDFEQGSLTALAQAIPQIPISELEDLQSKVARVATYLSQMAFERVTNQKSVVRDLRYKAATDALQELATELADLSPNLELFWGKANKVLTKLSSVISAPCAMILTLDKKKEKVQVKSVFGLPYRQFKNQVFTMYETKFFDVLESGNPAVAELEHINDPTSISGKIQQLAPGIAIQINRAIITRINAGNKDFGFLIFFFGAEHDLVNQSLREELEAVITQSAILLGAAYHNTLLYQARLRDIQMDRAWIEQVAHQILAPLNAVRGHAENAWRRVYKWENSISEINNVLSDREIQRWKYSFEDIMSTAHYAARLAANLAWVVYNDKQTKQTISTDITKDIGGMLIRSARNFQSLARERNIRTVKVNTPSIIVLNKQICLREDLFRQAIENLIDNAVKYGHGGSEIIIDGGLKDNIAFFEVSNEGIRLRAEDSEKIFEYEYRTTEARRFNAPGTGIGLFVAKQIIEMHGGTLKAIPSVYVEGDRWYTVFRISLPIRTNCD